jgi:hypothetical protein
VIRYNKKKIIKTVTTENSQQRKQNMKRSKQVSIVTHHYTAFPTPDPETETSADLTPDDPLQLMM